MSVSRQLGATIAAVLASALLALAMMIGSALPASGAPGVTSPSGDSPGTAAGTSPSTTADPADTPTGDTGAPPVILIGTSGLRWDDVDPERTPALWGLLEQGSVGVISIRNVRSVACPVDGWLALSAGRRAGDVSAGSGRLCRAVPPLGSSGVHAWVPDWDQFVALAENGTFDAHPGLLSDTLSAAGVPTAAIGRGAGIALANSEGIVPGAYYPGSEQPDRLGATVTESLTSARLVVVDVGALRDPENLADTDPEQLSPPRAEQAEEIDARIAAVLAASPQTATVMVASLADSGYSPHLQLLAMTGPAPAGSSPSSYGPGLVGSSSTRQDAMVQVTDLLPTLLALVGAPAPSDLPGASVLPQPHSPSTADRLQRVLDLDSQATHIARLVPVFFNGLVIAQILLYGAGTIALRKEWGGIEGRRRVLAVLRRVAIVFASVPISTFLANLVPWWRSSYQLATIVGAVCLFVTAISVVALLGPWRDRRLGPLGFVGGVTAGVLALDVATGSRLQISSLMGLQPLVAGRFYGLGNVQFALFSSGSIMLATSLADAALKAGRRRLAVVTVCVIGVIAVAIDGTPGLGSDFGGPPAMIPAFLLLALMVAGVRITVRRLLVIGLATLVVVSTISILDWLRPPSERTHLGRFVQTLLEGGAGQVIMRKAAQNWEILTGSWLTLLVPFGAVFIAVILMRPVAWGAPALQRTYEAAPTLKHGLIALCVLLAIGFAVNDSGTVVPAIGAVLVIPLLIAASVRTLEMADAEARDGPAGEASLDESDPQRIVRP
ncbi:MAG: hypothetical protein ACK5MT_13770 [Actinomycetales bacterium]